MISLQRSDFNEKRYINIYFINIIVVCASYYSGRNVTIYFSSAAATLWDDLYSAAILRIQGSVQ